MAKRKDKEIIEAEIAKLKKSIPKDDVNEDEFDSDNEEEEEEQDEEIVEPKKTKTNVKEEVTPSPVFFSRQDYDRMIYETYILVNQLWKRDTKEN